MSSVAENATTFKSEVLENILLVSKEVIHEYIRANHSTTFSTRSDNLHQTINTSSNIKQSRKSRVAVCAETKAIDLGWKADSIIIIDTDLGYNWC
ncbi:hypothetical protein L2227_07825 [Wolbachia endosymbiont of Delia radicum]|uniref:hypothetical protein n=1 Tax=Wolbachia endosymbiont of Delia radicum TaxID=502352 RepID=UPI001F278FA4|nr:hypothetical protein [Wolbachia endosymbiont of Delia radicum]UJQ21016.1 hypothetical protein L2227_07825 [Wolbachia endosymbiont of Delia radicum]